MNKFLIFINFLFNLYFIKSNLIYDNYLKTYFNEEYIEAIKDSEYFDGFLLEFEYNKANNCYQNINFKDEYNLKISKSDDGSFIKDFKNVDGSNFEEKHRYFGEYEENDKDECGHLFKIKVKDPHEKIYIVYLSFNNTITYDGTYYNTFKKEKKIEETIGGKKVSINIDEKLIEFESICCFEFIRYTDFFKNCVNLEKVILKNWNKNKTNIKNIFKKNYHCNNVFEGCKNLKEVDLSEFFLLKDNYGFPNMFSDCEKIEKLILNNSEDNTVFYWSFINCKKIKSITFVNKNKDINVGEQCFMNCNNLESLNNIENKLYLRNNCSECFKNCKNIKKLKLNIDETKFNSVYEEYKDKLKKENLTEEEKRANDINKCIDFKNALEGTEIDDLEINTADNIDLNIFASHIETLVKSGKVLKFTFNGHSIHVQDGVDLKEFMSDPEGYLERNPQFKYIEKPDQTLDTNYKNLENVEANVDKNQLGCLSCCSKCFSNCCCCCHKNKENR